MPLLVRQHDRHLNLAAPAQNLERHVIAVTGNAKVDRRGPELQLAQDHLVEESRQPRIAQPDFAARHIELEPQCRFQQREGRRAGPGLRRTGYGIERRPAMLLAPEAALNTCSTECFRP